MNYQERIYTILTEQYGHGGVPGKCSNPHSMSDKDLEHYKGKPSRKKVKAKKKADAKKKRFEAGQKIFGKLKDFTTGAKKKAKVDEHQFKERPGWSKKKPKPKNKWAPRGRTKYSKKGRESKDSAAERWAWRDPEGVDPKNPHRTGYEPTIHARGLRNRRTGDPIKKRR